MDAGKSEREKSSRLKRCEGDREDDPIRDGFNRHCVNYAPLDEALLSRFIKDYKASLSRGPEGSAIELKYLAMLPALEGLIARRILLNYRADTNVVQRLLPPPLQVEEHRGYAIVGVCLIRLERLRPRGIPGSLGVSSENMAHRVAIRYPTAQGNRPGVLIWRRETDQKLIELFGGRIFPGVYHHARFDVSEDEQRLAMCVCTRNGEADVSFTAGLGQDWNPSASFPTLTDASEFFRNGDCGFSCSVDGERLEGMQMRTQSWNVAPLAVESQQCSFYLDPKRFPTGSVEFDCALIMRGLPHEWHEITDVPELASVHR